MIAFSINLNAIIACFVNINYMKAYEGLIAIRKISTSFCIPLRT